MVLNQQILGWSAAGLLLLLAGCGGGDDGDLPATVEASGVVLLDGKPVHGASVVFAQVEPGKYAAFASTDSNGRFELRSFEAKEGAVPGSYQVQVSKTVEVDAGAASLAHLGEDAAHAAEDPDAGLTWKNALPQEYASLATSGITINIPETGTSEIKLELVSRP